MRMRTSAAALLSLTGELLGNCSPGDLARPEQTPRVTLASFRPLDIQVRVLGPTLPIPPVRATGGRHVPTAFLTQMASLVEWADRVITD
jgi:hypothetical protein